ncbi:hypothetical protein [Massilia eburnea]|uniref:hypothetical protein n=1 Tax=Massilia eburnea TaxID=1776165 RepID=UPI003D6BCCA7
MNASVFYEKNSYSVRLSYNYRSKSYGGLDQGGQDVTSAYGQWDATANWDITPQLSIFASAVNIGNELIRTKHYRRFAGWCVTRTERVTASALRGKF